MTNLINPFCNSHKLGKGRAHQSVSLGVSKFTDNLHCTNSIVKRSDTLFVNNKISCKGGVYSSFSKNGQTQKKCIALSIKQVELAIPNKLQTTLPVLIQRRAFKNYGRCQSPEELPQMKFFSCTKAQKAMVSDS